MTNCLYDSYRILTKVYADKTYIKQAITETDIDPLNKSFTVKLCYGTLDKDIELGYYIEKLTDKTPRLAIRTILKISMYAIKYLNKKDYFIVKSAVDLTKKLGKSGASGFVNAFLRKFISQDIPLPVEETEYLSVKYSYPEFAVSELIKDYGKDRAEKIMGAAYPDNTLCFYDTDGKRYLEEISADYKPTPFNNVFSVKKFVRNSDYDKGVYTYQSLGSVAICEEVAPCENLLDCCAAPGGKSVRLSYKCKNVVSWDIHEHRVSLIESYAKRMKRNNIKAEVRDAKVLLPELFGKFDAVLCDAPCSGLGVVGDDPDIKLNRTESGIYDLMSEQSTILNSVCNYVKIGGFLYYSTCSVLKKENIERITSFLEFRDDFVIEEINSPLAHENLYGTNAFLPDISEGNGYFVAKLKRIK